MVSDPWGRTRLWTVCTLTCSMSTLDANDGSKYEILKIAKFSVVATDYNNKNCKIFVSDSVLDADLLRRV